MTKIKSKRTLHIWQFWVCGLRNLNLTQNCIPTSLFKKLDFISYHLNETVRERYYFWECLMWLNSYWEVFLQFFINFFFLVNAFNQILFNQALFLFVDKQLDRNLIKKKFFRNQLIKETLLWMFTIFQLSPKSYWLISKKGLTLFNGSCSLTQSHPASSLQYPQEKLLPGLWIIMGMVPNRQS